MEKIWGKKSICDQPTHFKGSPTHHYTLNLTGNQVIPEIVHLFANALCFSGFNVLRIDTNYGNGI